MGLVAGCNTPSDEPIAEEAAPQVASNGATLLDANHPQAVPGEYIVVFHDGTSASKAKAQIDGLRAQGVDIFTTYSVIPAFAGRLDAQQLAALQKNPAVAFIEANKYVQLDATYPNPPYGLDRIDQRTGTNNSYDDFGFNGSGVQAYIIDTGVRTTHSEFTGRIGTSFSAVNGSPSFEDCHGHGTHVASTVAGTKYGVAKGATVHAVRVLDCGGSGTYDDVIEGMDWVRNNAGPFPSVVNMSLGGGASAAVNAAVLALTNANIPVVVAAGNDYAVDACTRSPAGAPSALTVGATNPGETRAAFSNVGNCVDLFAPGVNVLGAGIGNDNATATLSGTSMASPHVAGAVALYMQRWPRLPASKIHDAVIANTTPNIVGDARSPNRFLYTNFGNPTGNSCYGRCGGQSPDFTCACDEVCKVFGDCCPDYEAICR